ncbi:MAG: LptF/LptG family permease [Spirochaetaceae bacterium]|nr:LptF/LptG family permease [Spirochaetaceae bacterium]
MTFIMYLCKRFWGVFLGALFFFAMALCLVDMFMNLWRYIAQNVAPGAIFKVSLLYIPKAVSFSVPLAILFGAAYILSDLYAKNELTAIFASGVSLFRFSLPLLVIAAALGVGLFFFEDRVVVPTYHQKNELQNTLLGTQPLKNASNAVVICDGGRTVYRALMYDANMQILYVLYVVSRDENNHVTSILRAQSAAWKDDKWNINDGVLYSINDGKVSVNMDLSGVLLTEPPESFESSDISIEEVTVDDARKYIDYRRRAGLPYAEALSVYYKKYSFPCILFIVVFLSIGLSGRTRKNVLLVSLLLCIGAAVAYYVLQMVTMLLAKFEYIPPLAGAWMPVVFFVICSCFLLKTSRT